MTRPTQITIDLNALRYNLAQVRQKAPASSVLAMVKSNGYGHGIIRAAFALSEADALGVACFEEGMQLRQAGVKSPIVLMEGLFYPDELQQSAKENFTLIVHHHAQLDMLKKSSLKEAFSVWLKIDTGMHRLGFAPDEAREVYQQLMNCPAVKKPVGWITHFSESDARNKPSTQNQMNLFNKVVKGLPGPRSLANSGGILAWPESHADWVRPGIMLYGVSPFSECEGREFGLQPVMSLTSELIAVHSVKKGEAVGYGGTWSCPEDMRVGIVAVGYGDGYPWHAKNGTPVLVNQKRCPLIGRVAMDMLTVDLRTQPTAKVGDPVVLWGKDLPVEIVAAHSSTIGYELLTRIAPRVRVVVAESEAQPANYSI